jgi:serine/threonine protein kinase
MPIGKGSKRTHPSHPSIPQRELSQSDFPFTLGQKARRRSHGRGLRGPLARRQESRDQAPESIERRGGHESASSASARPWRRSIALTLRDSWRAARFRGRAWIAMSHIEGRSLEEIVQREGPMELLAALQLLNPIAELLAECHAKGISHRDVKPENIVISKLEGERHAVLVDFGLVKIRRGLDSTVSGDGQSLTATGTMLGDSSLYGPGAARGQKRARTERPRGRCLEPRRDLVLCLLGELAPRGLGERQPVNGPSGLRDAHASKRLSQRAAKTGTAPRSLLHEGAPGPPPKWTSSIESSRSSSMSSRTLRQRGPRSRS